MDKQTVFYRIRKAKLFTLLFHTEAKAASPVGSGEPFTHSDITEIIAYMKVFFPCVGINTNAPLLSTLVGFGGNDSKVFDGFKKETDRG